MDLGAGSDVVRLWLLADLSAVQPFRKRCRASMPRPGRAMAPREAERKALASFQMHRNSSPLLSELHLQPDVHPRGILRGR